MPHLRDNWCRLLAFVHTLGHLGSQKGAKWRPWAPLHRKIHIRNFHPTESFKKKDKITHKGLETPVCVQVHPGNNEELVGGGGVTLSAPEECNQVECDQQL